MKSSTSNSVITIAATTNLPIQESQRARKDWHHLCAKTPMIKSAQLLHHQLTGKPENTSLQARIFHTICIVILLLLPIALLINLETNIPYISSTLCGAFVITGFLYYNSRYRGNNRTSVIIFSVFLQLLLIGNYFLNSGIQGPSCILFILSLIFIMAVMPKKQYVFWVPLNILITFLLLYTEYLQPNLIKATYSSRTILFQDMAFSYFAAVICIALVFTYILRSYQIEKDNALTALKALKKEDEAKTKLLSILSHDLKAPLNSIQSFLEILVNYDLEKEEEKVIQKSLLKETKNTQTMLFNMLSWTKSQMEGGIKVKLSNLNLQEALKIPIAIQRAAAMEKVITLTAQIDPAICVHADADMIQLVVRNLLNNAVKFTKTGGDILVSAKKMSDGYALITVKDNGIGIAKEKQASLFSLKSESTYGTSNEKGVGLGLTLCQEFTHLQGGKLTFNSSTEQGSEFYLSIPLCHPDVVVGTYKPSAVLSLWF